MGKLVEVSDKAGRALTGGGDRNDLGPWQFVSGPAYG
jgi:hypothetical protein